MWIDADIAADWIQESENKRGGLKVTSALTIESCLALPKIYHLPLSQKKGFLKSLFELLNVTLPVPCYTTLCRRSNGLAVNLAATKGAITDIVMDSTWLKVNGEGEWKVRKHGEGKHRTWMKLHLATNGQTQKIEPITLTSNAVDDATEVESLMNQISKPVKVLWEMALMTKKKKKSSSTRKYQAAYTTTAQRCNR